MNFKLGRREQVEKNNLGRIKVTSDKTTCQNWGN